MSRLADNPGVYEDFSGKIQYKDTDCEVRNADFELLEELKKFKNKIDVWVEFERGDVVSGNLYNANIKHCNFYGSKIRHSVFHNGIFDGGEFAWSYWYDGTWEDGVWIKGFDKFGRSRLFHPPFDKFNKVKNIITEPGRYKDFTGCVKFGQSDFMIKNGELEIGHKGNWDVIIVDAGVITEGVLDGAIINYAIFNGDKMYDCNWKDGIFKKGTFESGIFDGGIWESGTFIICPFAGGAWRNGTWLGGFDGEGDWHSAGDSPDNWELLEDVL